MRKLVRAGTTVAASVALITVMAPGAEAATAKRGDLKVCFENTIASLGGLKFDAVADGPSFRSKTLSNDKCKRWHVRAGQYEIKQDNQREFFGAIFGAKENPCAENFFPELSGEVTRNGEDYDIDFGRFAQLTTNVKKNRTTKIEFRLSCVKSDGIIVI